MGTLTCKTSQELFLFGGNIKAVRDWNELAHVYQPAAEGSQLINANIHTAL